jgi:UTP:GlnB (protein PII) uridylyltransferase
LLRQSPLTPASTVELRQRLCPAILEALGPQYNVQDVERFLDTMPARYLVATPPDQIARHLILTQPTLGTSIVVYPEQNFSGGFTNVTICVAERRGVFSMIAGALSRNKLNILGAQIYTSRHGVVVDTLQVETLEKTPVTDQRVWQQVEADLHAALGGALRFETVLTQHRLRRTTATSSFAQLPQVLIENTSRIATPFLRCRPKIIWVCSINDASVVRKY